MSAIPLSMDKQTSIHTDPNSGNRIDFEGRPRRLQRVSGLNCT
jgi:hypothetical protein